MQVYKFYDRSEDTPLAVSLSTKQNKSTPQHLIPVSYIAAGRNLPVRARMRIAVYTKASFFFCFFFMFMTHAHTALLTYLLEAARRLRVVASRERVFSTTEVPSGLDVVDLVNVPHVQCPPRSMLHMFNVPHVQCSICSLPHTFNVPHLQYPTRSRFRMFNAPHVQCPACSMLHMFNAPHLQCPTC